MVEIWFGLLSLAIIVYVVLDGWNIGAGALHYFLARTPEERRIIYQAMGPLWSWHEVWLIAAGGTLFVAFPRVLAISFAGFYLALFLVLWCLLLRGISVEFRNHVEDPLWRSGWDFAFEVSSVLLALLLGAAGGNVMRGVPLNAQQKFSMALFTDFGVRGNVGILDWYTISVAVFAFVSLCAHGATYVALKTEGVVNERSRRMSYRFWWVALLLLPAISAETWYVRPELFQGMVGRPIAWTGILLIFSGATSVIFPRSGEARRFFGSCALLAGLLGTAAASLFPSMLYSTYDPRLSITAHNGAAGEHGLRVALYWWPFALVLSAGYVLFVLKHYSGKVASFSDPQQPY